MVETKRIEWTELDEFTTQFLETALWATGCYPEDGEDGDYIPYDEYLDISDLPQEVLREAVETCDGFRKLSGWDDLDLDDSDGGHNLLLTMDGHGAGFWDGDYPENGDKLTKDAKSFGNFHDTMLTYLPGPDRSE